MSDKSGEFITTDEFASIYNENIMSREAQEIFSPEFTEHLLAHGTVAKMYGIAGKLCENAKKFNLTSILEPREIVRKHILDSLLPLGIMQSCGIVTRSSDVKQLADIGCGAGFPSLPIAAASAEYINLHTVCIDSTEKKIRHVNETIDHIGIHGTAEGISARAEELSSLRGRFDITTARAVASLPVLLELCAPLTKKGGCFIAMKSHADDEVNASEHACGILGMSLRKRVKYSLPGGDERELIIFDKKSATPKEYPRRYSEITKKPL